ncbi:MAG: 1-(5-phosphoribosyl)-5-[(5-phosphoribosylamino)methylideneamino]imidazole-4-carboxamide isomerase [Acidimicrobiales bacterium]
MVVFPAIDLRGGRCVRLVEGDFAKETVYGDDPVAVARRFAAEGAAWIHVVDLDAARTGEPVNRDLVTAIAEAVRVPVQSGGGIRCVTDAEALLDGGIARVVLGTAAVEDPSLVAALASRWPGRVAVGVDHRGGEVRLRGWVHGAGRRVLEVVNEAVAAGAAAAIVTDISRDGRLVGPDVEGLARLVEATGGAPLVASGGVASLDDLRRLAGAGVVGVIVGKALYEGSFTLAEAIVAAGPAGTADQ